MRFEKIKKIFIFILKLLMLFAVARTAWLQNMEYAGIAVLLFILCAYAWKWESKILLFSGLFLLFAPAIFLPLGRNDLAAPHLAVYGWILVGVWCVEIIDYAAKQWPAYVIPPVKAALDRWKIKQARGKESLRQALAILIQKRRDASEKTKLGVRHFFLLLRDIILFFVVRIAAFVKASGIVVLTVFRQGVHVIAYGIRFLARKIFSVARKSISTSVHFLVRHRRVLLKTACIVLTFITMYFFLQIGFGDTFVWLFFLCGILFHWKMEVGILFSMSSLLFALGFLMFHKSGPADAFGIYAYYFLIIALIFEFFGKKYLKSKIHIEGDTVHNFFSPSDSVKNSAVYKIHVL